MNKPSFIALLLLLFSVTAFAKTPPPSNDDCSGAITLTAGSAQAGTVWAATNSGIGVGTATGNPDDDVWFKFTTPASNGTNATLTLSAIGTDLSASGAMMQIFSGSCGSLTAIGYANGAVLPLAIILSNNTPYFIRVYSYATGALASSGGSAFTITYTSSIKPSNDDCSGAIMIPTNVAFTPSTGWFAAATTSSGAPTCGAGPFNWDVWYKFIATKTTATVSLADVSVSNTVSTSARIQAFSGDCVGGLTSLGCTSASSGASGLLALSSLSIGTPYYIRVFSTSGSAFTTGSANKSFNIGVTDGGSPTVIDSTVTLFNRTIIAKNLGFPWEIENGPDDSLWITEARGYRVVRISKNRTSAQANVPVQQVLKIPLGGTGNPGPNFDRNYDINSTGTWPQGGMEGLAIHPEWKADSAKELVYIAYVYGGTCASNPGSPCIFRSKIIQCKFYYATETGNPSIGPVKHDTLVIVDTLISNLPGSNDHNSGRLKFGPIKEGSGTPTYKLYYTIGDMGAGQFNNASRTNNAQNKDTCEGKILRLNSEKDGDASFGVTHDYNKWREWIPNDNPFTHSVFTTLRTPIFSYGHRNAQGLAWGKVNGVWRLYSSEHGDQSGDEVNIIQMGNNYGWPKVTGMADNNYTMSDDLTNGFVQNDVLAAQNVSDEVTFAENTGNFTRPMFDFFNWSPAQIQSLNTGNIYTWPTIAPSSIGFYNGNIPGWKNSLLVTSLKYGMFRLKLKPSGDFVDSTAGVNAVDTFPLLHGWRLRDVAIDTVANSGRFWVITDSTGSTSGPTGGFSGGNQPTLNGGTVMLLQYKTLLTLPINFESFTGKLQANKTIRLDWKAETDQYHDYFEVEKSINNVDFFSIGKVYGGDPYYLVDPNPNIGNNYYRIKNTEKGGNPSYSKVINIIYDPSAWLVDAYPNPIRNVLDIKITAPKSDNIRIQVSDMQGRIVHKESRAVTKGDISVKVDASAWSSQMYSLEVVGSDNKVLSVQKIMKL